MITLLPPLTEFTSPVVFTVATETSPESQGSTAAAVPDPVSWVVEPVHTDKVPVMVGNAFTVTVAVLLQPELPLKVITLVPAVNPFTRPVLLTVAIAGDAEAQGVVGSGEPAPLNWVVEPIQTPRLPVIAGTLILTGKLALEGPVPQAFVPVTLKLPPVPVDVTVMVLVPSPAVMVQPAGIVQL